MSVSILNNSDFENLVKGGNISIHIEIGDTLNGDMLEDVHKDKNYSFKNFKRLEQKYFLNSEMFTHLVGKEVIVHYPDNSSWSTCYHLEVVKINRVEIIDPETSNDEGFKIVLETLKDLPDEHPYKYYHEPSRRYLDDYRKDGTPWKIFISPELHEQLKK
tara:strand:- start:2006 stop:2485 length:480 start_codon:yes stop_codon:yes gene_type:complete